MILILKIVKTIKADIQDYSYWKKRIKNKRYTPIGRAGTMPVYCDLDEYSMQSDLQTLTNIETSIFLNIKHLREYNKSYANNLREVYYDISGQKPRIN
jgi:hypothetical protein